jgi:hypothetical protein
MWMISGIRNRGLKVLALGTALLLGGCQQSQEAQGLHVTHADKLVMLPPKQTEDRVNETPILTDEAMEVRQWPVSAATYPNFSVTAGPALVTFVPRDDLKPWFHAVLETPLFLINTLLTTSAMFQTAPWEQVEATSLYLPPSYTCNPPSEPMGRNDYSGGTGIGWTPAIGRAATFPAQ